MHYGKAQFENNNTVPTLGMQTYGNLLPYYIHIYKRSQTESICFDKKKNCLFFKWSCKIAFEFPTVLTAEENIMTDYNHKNNGQVKLHCS